MPWLFLYIKTAQDIPSVALLGFGLLILQSHAKVGMADVRARHALFA